MQTNEEFSNYENIYYIFANVYRIKKENANTKAYMDLISRNFETLIHSPNGSVGKSCNNKLEVYNQALNLQNKLEDEIWRSVVDTYKNLPYRIRMEVSKRIRLNRSFTPMEFMSFDILGQYFEAYKQYILENVLNFDIIEYLYNEWTKQLANRLIAARQNRGFTYVEFIYQNQIPN